MAKQEHKTIGLSLWIAVLLILAAAMSRILPHPYNFTPVVGMTLFGAAHFKKKWIALALPLVAMLLSDIVLNNFIYAAGSGSFVWFTPGAVWIYGSILLIGLIGFVLFKRKISWERVLGSSLSGSLLFFFITNFGVWLHGTMYAKSWSGLVACYAAGIPFLQNAVLGDLFYCGLLFGSYYLIKTYAFKESPAYMRY